MKKLYQLLTVLLLASFFLAACAPTVSQPIATELPQLPEVTVPPMPEKTEPPVVAQPIATQLPAKPEVTLPPVPVATELPAVENKLTEVLARGYLIVSTDPAYPPQSQLVEGGTRPADTVCPPTW